jgi:hypothetical protein
MTGKGRAHLITGGLLLGLIVAIILLWSNPMVLVWVLLGIMAVMAYGVLYLLVQSRMPKTEETDDAEDEHNDDDDDRETSARVNDDVDEIVRPSPRPRVRRTEAPTRAAEPSREVSRELPNGRVRDEANNTGAVPESRPKSRAPRRVKRPTTE